MPAANNKIGQNLEVYFKKFRYYAYLLRRNPVTVIGMVITLGLFFVALFSPWIAPYNPIEQNIAIRLQPPTVNHPFGTDEFGRDILSRVLWGSRLSLGVGILVVIISLMIGTILGAVAGFLGGLVNEVIMRTADLFLSFPSLILAVLIAATLGPGQANTMIALVVSWWPWYTRIVQAQVLTIKESRYVESAKAIGAGNIRIIVHHILPNCVSPIIVQATMDFGYAILATSTLSFIGLGAQPPTPEWGLMVSEGRSYIVSGEWWMITFPGLFLMVAVLGFLLLGDGLCDILNPRLK
jgi:peptide/nickel transport system permease protein